MKKNLVAVILIFFFMNNLSAQTGSRPSVSKYQAVIFTTAGGELRGILAQATDSSLVIFTDYDEKAYLRGHQLQKFEVKASNILKVRLRQSSDERKIFGAIIGGVAGGVAIHGMKEAVNSTSHAITTLIVPYGRIEEKKPSFDGINILGILGGAGVGLAIGSTKKTKKEYFIGGNADFFKPLKMELQPYTIQLIK